jgi:lipopolysaccharide transport system ATP-binding protein
MSNGTAIAVSNLSKTYRISHAHRPNRATEAIADWIRNPLRRAQTEYFDALHEIDFVIPRGEAVGIIGRNGAGKSTLLKLLTRITAPTTGRIELHGRVGSLLEVGTGFHPELTGRENVFLNGTLLGMRRREIRRRFDEIVEFAGVERFLDTPVKRYSSGMYVRLAFAVAAHLDTEILAIDEVLAVGDAEFQRKSVAKMRDAAADGRTVLFVSHQMQTVMNLCSSALFLAGGRLDYHGGVEHALARYRATFEEYTDLQRDAARRPGTGELRIIDETPSSRTYTSGERLAVGIRLPATTKLTGRYYVAAHVVDSNGVTLVQCDSRLVGTWLEPDRAHELVLTIDDLMLVPGRYAIDVFACGTQVIDAWEGAATFDVLPDLPYPESAPEDAYTHGAVLSNFRYSVR